MRQPTYGEIAFNTLNRLLEVKNKSWDERSEEVKLAFENTAAAVIAEFRKRQIELSRQTPAPELATPDDWTDGTEVFK